MTPTESDDGIRFTPVSEEPLFSITQKTVFDDGAPRYFKQLRNARVSLNDNNDVVAMLLDAVANPEDTNSRLEVLVFPVNNYNGSLSAQSTKFEHGSICKQPDQLSNRE